jgi:hypothetical protein
MTTENLNSSNFDKNILNSRCAPSKKFYEGSCFDLNSLIKIANKYNQTHDDKINVNNNKKTLVKEISEKLSKSCSDQVCWLRTDLLKSIKDPNIHNDTFRPEGPQKKNEWLSTTHINDVLEQYHNKHDDFLFLGAVPYDFEELSMLGLNNVNFDDFIKNGKHKLGLVINLDEHDQSGSHWVALYADLSKNNIYFFDSVGKKPGTKIKKFINKITNYLYKKKYNENINVGKIMRNIKKNKKNSQKYVSLLQNKLKEFDIKYNNIQHQFKNSECGVYSMNFIIRLIKGETFEEITNNITKDDEINKCRESYFRNVIIS